MSKNQVRLYFAIPASAIETASGVRMRVPIVPQSAFVKGKISGVVTRHSQDEIVAAFSALPSGEIPGDYEHATENPEIAQGGPLPASGWLKGYDGVDASGILWATIDFTPRAKAMIDSGEYKYISPVLGWKKHGKDGEIQGAFIKSFALTNTPLFFGTDTSRAVVLEGVNQLLPSADNWQLAAYSIELEQEPAVNKTTAAAETAKGATPAMEKSLAKMNAAGTGQEVTCAHCNNTSEADMPEGHDQQFVRKGAAAATTTAAPAVAASDDASMAASTITLADLTRDPKTGVYDFDRLPAGKTLMGSAVFVVQRQQQAALAEVAAAVNAGKITPADRDAFTLLATSDIENFRAITKGMKGVDLREHGHAGNQQLTSGEQVDAEIETLCASAIEKEKGLSYDGALLRVFNEHPDLKRRRAEAMDAAQN